MKGEWRKLLSPDGKFFMALPQIYDFPYVGIGLDWFATISLQSSVMIVIRSKTLDQFTEVLYAMKDAYPEIQLPTLDDGALAGASMGLIKGQWGHQKVSFYDLNEKCYKFGPQTEELKNCRRMVMHSWPKIKIFEVNFNLSSTEWQEYLTTGKGVRRLGIM